MAGENSVHWSFWAIGIVTLLYNCAGVVNFATQMNAEAVAAMPEAFRAIVDARPGWVTGSFAVAVIGGAIGCVLLLLRQSAAPYVFVASLVGAIVTLAHGLGLTGSEMYPTEFLAGNVAQLALTVFLIWYSMKTLANA